MKTVADLFANSHVVLGKTVQSDRHFVHVERLPGDTPDAPCTWVKSVEPGQLQNEYWVAREKNLLMLLKKLPQVARLRKDEDAGDSAYHTVRTRDAGITLENWLKMKPQHIASGHSLEHPFAQVGSFLRLTRGLLTALKALHREGIIHANIDAANICLPYHPAPFRFDSGIRPDYANLCLIDFMFAVSSTLRLYRPLAVKPLAPPSYHSGQFRAALEKDHAAQRAEAIQDIDYSVDLYALGHLLEDIFQRGLIYPGNMQSQMEMTIYNLIHELLGFDDGIPDSLSEKYGSTLPHDVYIKRIDNMLALDPAAGNEDHDMLLLDPNQPLGASDRDETPAEQIMTEPHQPAPEPSDLHGDPLLMSASTPDPTVETAPGAPVAETSYFEINKWLVVAVLVVAQIINFIYHDGDSIHLDVVLSILLVLAVASGLLAALYLLAPQGSLVRYIPGLDRIPAEHEPAADFAPPSLREEEYLHISPLVVVAIIVSLQLSGLFYAHGEGMGLDVMSSILVTLICGLGFAGLKLWYDRFVTPAPIKPVSDDEDEDEAATLTAVSPEKADAEPVAERDDSHAAVPVIAATAAVTAVEAAAEPLPVEAPAPAATPEQQPVMAEEIPVMAAPVVAEESFPVTEAPAAVTDVPVEPVAPARPAANDDAPALAAAARTVHDDSTDVPADDTPVSSDGAAAKHLELDNRIVIVVVILLLLLFFYLSKPDGEPGSETDAAAPMAEIEAPMTEVTEEPGLPEAVPALEADPAVSVAADDAAMDDLLSAPAATTAPAARTPAAKAPAVAAAAQPARAKPVKPAKAAAETAAAAETESAGETSDAVETATAAAPAAEAAPAAAAETPAEAKPVTAVLTGTAPPAPAKPLGNSLAQAQNIMGWHYFKGISVPKDHPEALRWFRKAAQMGDASGQFNLGMMYANGYGTAKNQQEAARWFKLAADQGKANAQLNLGLMHLSGRGVEQNTAEGMRLLRLSAEAGDKNAQANLDAIARAGKPLPVTP